MSVSSGLATWSGFLRSIRKYSKLPEVDLEALLSQSKFEEAVDALAGSMPARLFDERIEHNLRVDNPDGICGAILCLPDVFDNLILTTNLDNILEQLYSGINHNFDHVLHGRLISGYRTVKASAARILLKLHGTCNTGDGRVLGVAEYNSAYAPGSAVHEELSLIYKTKNLLCLGCSLGPDRTVSLVSAIATSDPVMPKHYAFLPEPSSVDARLNREHFLAERGIYPIWYQGDHDDIILSLLVGMLKHVGKI